MNLMDKFILEIAKIKDVELFCGIGKILHVKLLNEDNSARDFSEVLDEILKAYSKLPKSRRKELYTILRDANKQTSLGLKEKKDASNS